MKPRLLLIVSCLLFIALSSCGTNIAASSSQKHPTPTVKPPQIALDNCPERSLSPSITIPAPSSEAQAIYVGSMDKLYAINATNGAMLWCKQLSITAHFECPRSCPSPPSMRFGVPTVVGGIVYVCASGYGGGYTYAFHTDNGALLWKAQSNCVVVDIPFSDDAVPLVDHGIVYTGSYALRAQDGKALWSTPIERISFQALVKGVLYANTQDRIYALNTKDGSERWHYEVPDRAPLSGRLVVGDNRLYFGTSESVDQAEKSRLYVLNAVNGSLLWQFKQGAYDGATLLNDLVFVVSRDWSLYALQANNGTIRWHFKPDHPAYTTPVGVQNVLYVNMDGPYALNAETGKIIWHQSLGASQSVVFTPSTVAGDVLYLARIDGQGNSTIYALNANTGATYWYSSPIRQVRSLVVA